MNKIITIILLFVTVNIFSQNCGANFSIDVLQQGSVQFSDSSSHADTNQIANSWYWDFGDGTSSTDQNPFHTYSDFSQNYYVCLTVTFTDNCSSTFCDSVYFVVPCNMYLTYTKTDVTVNGGNDGSIDISVFDYTGSLNFYWDSGQTTEDISGLTAGTYTIYVSDDSNCQVDTSITIVEPPVDTCNIYLTYTKTDVTTYGGNNGSIDISVFDNIGYVSYNWSNGETTEDINNLTANTYQLSVTDSIGCQIDTSITIVEPQLMLSLSGNVYAKTALLPDGIAVLIKKELTEYTAIAYTQITNGYYIFNNLDTADYLVYAFPYFGIDVNYFPIYFPSYSGDKINYEDATAIYVDSIHTKDISLEYCEEINHGQGYISGKLVYDYGSNFETAVYNQNWFGSSKSSFEGVAQNTAVFLINNSGNPIKYSLSDNNGEFEINDIPYGEYTVYTEKAGRTTQVFNVILSTENDSSINNLIHIQQGNVIEVKNIINNNINVYPNPFTTLLTIETTQIKEIWIVNVSGKVMNLDQNMTEINGTYTINTSNLKNGVYFLRAVSHNGSVITEKIIKINN